MTGGFLSLSASKASNVNIKTQITTDEGNPDIEISTDNYLIYVEVKIESELGKNQLKRYKTALNKIKDKKTKLILLSRYPLTSDKDDKPDLAVIWYQIAEWIENEIQKNKLGQLSQYLMEQFLGFLQKQKLVMRKVQSELSKGLKEYENRVGDILVALSNLRSFKKLDDAPELQSLRKLLDLMGEAIKIVFPNVIYRSLSGQHKGGWIGYSIEKMNYGFSIGFGNPEILEFNTLLFQIDESRYDGQTGKIWREGRRIRWKIEYDLLTHDKNFFNKSTYDQMKVIQDFLKQSYAYVQSIKM